MILMNDFRAEPAQLRSEMQAAVSTVLESGWYILGNACKSFEAEWAARCEVQHGIGVGNGMDAIEISLRAAGIGAGDEVITTPMTAFASVLAIQRVGATAVLADIHSDSALMSIESATRCISPRTRAVLLVHLYGQVRNMSAWSAFCEQHGLVLFEDCAQSHLARLQGRVAGSFGRAAAFSFYPTKNLGAPGDGGMIVTDDALIAERCRMLRNYGQSERYYHPINGLNSRLDELHAAILSVRLRWLNQFTERRRRIAGAYMDSIRNSAVRLLAPPEEPDAHVWHLFVIAAERRTALGAHLADAGVQTLLHYPVPMHRQPPCVELPRDPRGLSMSERHAETCLSLPCHPQMSDGDVNRVIDAVNAFRG
jgi:dTDP-4-amino-4,6-dideoxygalactose transaminase